MTELGELEKHHRDFAQRNSRIVVVSVEGRDEAEKTKTDYPHLEVVADQDRGLCSAVDLIHPHSAPHGGDTATPTTILIDPKGTVKWLFRPAHYIRRLSASELVASIDQHLLNTR